MVKRKTTSIAVLPDTLEELKATARKDQTYDDIICELIQERKTKTKQVRSQGRK